MKYDYNKALRWAFSNIIEPEMLCAIVNAINKQLPSKPYYRKEEDAEGWACPNCDMGVEMTMVELRIHIATVVGK